MPDRKALSQEWRYKEALEMKVIADFHTHSRFAMACSSKITVNGMETAAFEKVCQQGNVGLITVFTTLLFLTPAKAEENIEVVRMTIAKNFRI